MRILIDIGHPAHVHLFKNLALEMQKRGHSFFFTVREGENEKLLLQNLGFKYQSIGKKQKGVINKLLMLFFFSIKIYRISLRFKPDLFISHGSMYAGYAAFLLRKKHIALEDTGNMEQLVFSKPVSNVILSPASLQVSLGRKHIRYQGFHELAYLHPKRFTPNNSIIRELGLTDNEKFVIIRFIKWGASHDIGQTGLSNIEKSLLVKNLSSKVKVFISFEGPVAQEFQKFKLSLSPEKLHHLLPFASLYIGEGATTASECAVLGVPSIFVSPIHAGTIDEQVSLGLLFKFNDFTGVLDKSTEVLENGEIIKSIQQNRLKMLNLKIDVTAFLIWFVENYPESFRIMKEDPDYQYNFK